jgi:radical SAM protein with 4Fe4S-binding SPASM domain
LTGAAADRPDAFDWVDEYFAHVRAHIEVRPADALLIVLPNQAYKLNPTGLAILKAMKQGAPIAQVLAHVGEDRGRRREVFHFLCDFRSLMTGCLGEGRGRKAVSSAPHTEPFNLLPVLSELAVTYRCNLRCRFCYAACGCQGPSAPAGRGTEMSARQCMGVLEVIRRDAQVPSVSFTGGEPLLREDLEDLLAAAGRLKLRTNLITNATLLAGNRRAEALKSAGLASAQVSLEGPNADVHDALTGVPGSFDRTLEGLESLRRAGVHVHTNTTISTVNAPHLEGIVDLVAGLGARRMSANLVIPCGSAADLSLQVPYSRVGALVDRLRDRARQAGVQFLWYSPTPMCIFNPMAEGLGNKSCAACDGLLSISPAGDVLPCSSFPEPVGNLLKEPFGEVWQSARAVFLRDKRLAPAECEGCEDFVACAGACPLYWSAMGTGELAQAGRKAHAPA